jgi:Flp pilus assembly protein TadG
MRLMTRNNVHTRQSETKGTHGYRDTMIDIACRSKPNERGAVTVELVLVVPALVIMLGLLIAGGRLWFARVTVTEAAQSSARSASLARSASEATQVGQAAGAQSLSTAGLACSSQLVQVKTSAFGVEVGNPATITATVSCQVSFGDLLLPGMPGSIALTRTGYSALDTYRGRG